MSAHPMMALQQCNNTPKHFNDNHNHPNHDDDNDGEDHHHHNENDDEQVVGKSVAGL